MTNAKPQIYIVATPIGNLNDISKRALQILSEVNFILAEDSRITRRLLEHYGIKKQIIPFDDHNNEFEISKIIDRLKSGESAALVSDAGTPNISDPGKKLLNTLFENDLTVSAIPGPSAVTALMSVCPLLSPHFTFVGFLPKELNARNELLSRLLFQQPTLVFFEAPGRVLTTLLEISALSPNRKCFIGRELTKIHEQWLYDTIENALTYLRDNDKCRGEFIIAVEGALETIPTDEELLRLLKAHLLNMSLKDAVSEIHSATKVSKKKVYDLALTINREKGS